MSKDSQDQKRFLEEQLEWSVEQGRILDKVNEKLHEMKQIAEYALAHNLSAGEKEKLNEQLYVLKDEVNVLERQLRNVVH
ncbi:hypothetical protein GN156_05490 [bacterium LRH843]|nr:hypothetical protein [bacterium LRH843]